MPILEEEPDRFDREKRGRSNAGEIGPWVTVKNSLPFRLGALQESDGVVVDLGAAKALRRGTCLPTCPPRRAYSTDAPAIATNALRASGVPPWVMNTPTSCLAGSTQP